MARISKKSQSEMRNRILDTAFSHFQKRGYNQTNMREITQEAGIAEGTLYNYFPDKATLFLEAVATRLQSVIPEPSQQINCVSSSNVLQQFLIDKLHTFFSFPKDTLRRILAVFIGLNQQDSPLVKQLVSLDYQSLKDLKAVLDNLVKKGFMKSCDTELMSSIIYGILIFEMLNYLFDDRCSQENIFQAVQRKVDFFFEGWLIESKLS